MQKEKCRVNLKAVLEGLLFVVGDEGITKEKLFLYKSKVRFKGYL